MVTMAQWSQTGWPEPGIFGQFTLRQGGHTMETMYFVVESIDGDYANLRRTDTESGELRLVARALLPMEIMEGTRLKYEMLQYEIIG